MVTKDTDQISGIPLPALTHTLVISTQHPFLNFDIEISILRLQSSHQQKKHAKEATLFIVEYTQTQTSQSDPFTTMSLLLEFGRGPPS